METPILDAPQPTESVTYANFWIRFAAVFIDGLVLLIPGTAIQWILMGSYLTNPNAIQDDLEGYLTNYAYTMVIMNLLYWLYFALMESSEWQATLGKRAVNIKVTDLDGNRISFLRATGRFFGKILSSLILLVGYIMAAFTEKKQALHDILAGTLVVQNQRR